MCAENSGLASQKTINTLVKYVLGYIYINSWHDVIQKVNILVLEINSSSLASSKFISTILKGKTTKCLQEYWTLTPNDSHVLHTKMFILFFLILNFIHFILVTAATVWLTWYTARANDTLAFWPPLRVTPPSPTPVTSPFGSMFKSSTKQHASMTDLDKKCVSPLLQT
jgi:hypothetical protein